MLVIIIITKSKIVGRNCPHRTCQQSGVWESDDEKGDRGLGKKQKRKEYRRRDGREGSSALTVEEG